MTSPTRVLNALCQIELHRWGTRGAVLSYLAGRPQLPNGVTVSSLRDAKAFLRLEVRTIRKALRGLVEDGVIVISQSSGSRPAGILIRDPKEWGPSVPWRADRREAMIALEAFSALHLETQSAASARSWGRAQSLLVRGPRGAHYNQLVRAPGGAHNDHLRARPWGRALEPPLSTSSSRQRVQRSELEGGREREDLSDREAELMAAFMDGAGIEEVSGTTFRRLRRLAAESNGTLPRLVELARDLAGPGRFLDRLAQLEEAMVAPAGTDRVPCPQLSEREALERQIEILSKAAGYEDEVEELRAQLEEMS